jgi:hypothetical protein
MDPEIKEDTLQYIGIDNTFVWLANLQIILLYGYPIWGMIMFKTCRNKVVRV